MQRYGGGDMVAGIWWQGVTVTRWNEAKVKLGWRQGKVNCNNH